MVQKIEYTILETIETAVRNVKVTPLNLGGVSGDDGGSGGPPGGIIGQLSQKKVAYDSTEAETLFTPASGMSLLDNLNHIRYRIGELESGGVASSGVVVIDDNETVTYDPTTTIHFSGVGVSIDDIGGGEIRVVIQGGGDVEEAPIDGETYGRKDGEWVVISGGQGCPIIDDLSSQVTSSGNQFDLQASTDCPSGMLLFYNGVYQPPSFFEVDEDGDSIITDFIVYSGESLVAVYGFGGGSGSGASAFTDLSDVPSSYTGHGSKVVAVKSDVTGLEFITPSSGGRTLIDSQTPTGTGTVSFASIPGTYQKLIIEYVARGTQAVASVTMSVQLNGDTTATNYRRMLLVAFGASTVAGGGADNGVIDDSIISASGPANNASYGFIEFPFYANAAFHKQVLGRNAKRVDTATNHQLTEVSTLNWENASAITQIDLVLSAGNYDTGSTFNLYGEN